MRKLIFVAVGLSLVAAAAFAQGAPRKGAFGMQTAVIITTVTGSPAGSLGAKYMITDAIGVRAGLGILEMSGGGTSSTSFDLGAGFEYHFPGKGGVSPYLGAELGYSGVSVSGGGATPSDFGLNAVFGAEFFLSSNFSWGGEALLGFNSGTSGGVTTTTIGTGAVAFDLTWYLN